MTRSNSTRNHVNLVQIEKVGDLKMIEIFDNSTWRLEILLKFLAKYPFYVDELTYINGNVIIKGYKSDGYKADEWNTVEYNIRIESLYSSFESKYRIELNIKKTFWNISRFDYKYIAAVRIEGKLSSKKKIKAIVKKLINSKFS